ncbi:hypothetical protein Bca52824_079256, partial [Brassica carinata]
MLCWFKQKHKKALYEALEKVKAAYAFGIHITTPNNWTNTNLKHMRLQSVASSMHPCSAAQEAEKYGKKDSGKKGDDDEKPSHRLLLELAESFIPRRSLATKGYDKCAEKEKVAFVSAYGIHQLHIFIFVLRWFMLSTALLLAVVCFVLLFISIVLEHSIHKIGSWFKQKHKKALYEALEKVKAELMLLGFISLLLTIGQTPISNICVSKSVASSMHPCSAAQEAEKYGKKDSGKKGDDDEKPSHRLLLELAESFIPRRSLATKGYDKCAEKGKVAFVSAYGIHQLHIFIFVLAVVHVIYCIVTYALGKTK